VGLPLILLCSTIHSKLHHPLLIHEGSYYNPRFFLVGLSILPLIVYDFKQKASMIACLTINVGILILYNPIHAFFGASPELILGQELKNYPFITNASSISAMALIAAMFFLKRINYRYEKRIEGLLHTTSEQHEELKSSVRYAQRLQQHIIPDLSHFPQLRTRLQVVYLPKDIVSGDFFVVKQEANKYWLGVIDCTGHGVPGAFLSIMAHNHLQNAFALYSNEGPASVLEAFNQHIITELQKSHDGSIYDSMDISLFEIDENTRNIRYSGAKGQAIIKKGSETLHLPFERRSIGDQLNASFQQISISYQKGDELLIFSDGFIDQFGEKENKKLGKRRLLEIVKSSHSSGHSGKQTDYSQVFKKWQGAQEQTDDVCLLHFKL
jgi:serine phosphatase RsbU (regulator of sigma subunit)